MFIESKAYSACLVLIDATPLLVPYLARPLLQNILCGLKLMIQYLGNTVVKVGRLLPWQTFTFIINRLVSVTDPTTIETALQSSADTASMPPRPPYELCMPDTKNYGQPFLVQSAELKNCNEQRDAMSRTSSSSWNVRCVQRVLTGWVISTIYCSS